MKFILVFVGLIVISLATQQATQTACDKIEASLNTAGTVEIPQVVTAILISMVGLLTIKVDAFLDCTVIADMLDSAVEISYVESAPVDGEVTADIDLRVATDVELNLSSLLRTFVLELQTSSYLNVTTLNDVDIDMSLRVKFNDGDATNCKIKQITSTCTKTDCNIPSTGNLAVDTAVELRSTEICDGLFDNMKNTLLNTLQSVIET